MKSDLQGARRTVARTKDPREAEAAIAAAYLPNRVDRLGDGPLDLRLDSLQLDTATVGLVSFGAEVRLQTSEATHYHVNVPVSGHVVTRTADGAGTRAGPGQATVYMPDRPADLLWTEGASQLCLMVPKRTLEDELEELLDAPLTQPLLFAEQMDLSGAAARGWRASLDVVLTEIREGPGVLSHPHAARQLERLVVDGLLLAQSHTYADALARRERRPQPGPIAAARELLEERPGDPWSTSSLAKAVHVSVRSLQEGFASQLGIPPMRYLQRVRLRAAHARLLDAAPTETTVAAVASGLGLTHRSRFATAYRQQFAESPVETLRRH